MSEVKWLKQVTFFSWKHTYTVAHETETPKQMCFLAKRPVKERKTENSDQLNEPFLSL